MQGKELFDQHAMKWLASLGEPSDSNPIEIAFSRGKAQILDDVKQGRVSKGVASFSDLHDYVDANYYGNAFDWPALPSEMNDDDYQQAFADFWNAVQDQLSQWISSGQMRQASSQRRR